MKTSATRIALGLLIAAATLAASKGAHAQGFVHWRNASEPSGVKYYLGVAGGPICTPTRGCGYNAGTQIITWTLSQGDQNWLANYPETGVVQNEFGDRGVGDPWDLAVYGDSLANNTNLVIEPPGDSSETWSVVSAESIGAPYTGCYLFTNQRSGKVMAVYQGNVFNGAHVVQYDLCSPTDGKCGNPSNAYHPDQFWCPENP